MTTLKHKNLAPIVIFAYNRPIHLRMTIESLLQCSEAKFSDLYVYSDAPKSEECLASVLEVRSFLRDLQGFKSLKIINRKNNLGLANSILDGVSSIINSSGKAIVLEDDMVVSKYFLQYMNEGLIKYQDHDRVASIHGYVYPTTHSLPETFFMRGADCWGWATWSRVWNDFNHDGLSLMRELKERNLTRQFDFGGRVAYTKMLDDQIQGRNDSWAIRWHAAMFLANKYTLYPGESLVVNIGNDSSGTHCGSTEAFNVSLSQQPIILKDIPIVNSVDAEAAFNIFFSKSNSLFKKIKIFITLENVKVVTKVFLQYIFPPILYDFKRSLRYLTAPMFTNLNIDWDQAIQKSSGYSDPEILSKVLDSSIKVKNYWAAYERDSLAFEVEDYCWPLLASILWAASISNGRLHVLDYGGALGSTFYQNRRFIEILKDLSWSVIEQEHFVALGNQQFRSPNLKFYKTIEDAVVSNTPNVILISNVLQYLSQPYDVLGELMKVGADFIILDRIIVNDFDEDIVCIQNVPSSIYKASYPCRSFGERSLVLFLMKNYYLEMCIPTLGFGELGKINSKFKGYVFRKRANEENY